MKTIIHDLDPVLFEDLFPETASSARRESSGAPAVILSALYPIKPCIGCFGCWIKTPGSCVLPDSYQEMGKLLSRTDELILISRCFYGGFSPHVKNVLDRSIGYLQPFFCIVNGEMHHAMRHNNHMKLTAHFYGDDVTPQEKETAVRLVEANGINFGSAHCAAHFYLNPQEIRRKLS